MESKVAIAYIPVLHKGYIDYLAQVEQEGVTELYLIGDELLSAQEEFDYLNRKDRVRALNMEAVISFIQTNTKLVVKELTQTAIAKIVQEKSTIIFPKEDTSSVLKETYFKDNEVIFKNVYVRVNRENVGEDTEPETAAVALSDFQKETFAAVVSEAEKSADWWRQVAAALVQEGKLVSIAHNEHMPDEQLPNIFGDARSLFKKGININYVTTAHAEVGVIAAAAKQGITTEGAELYVTDFPCPYCARLVAKAGIKKVYYLKGYAVLEGDTFLQGEGVELIKVSL